MSRKNLVPIFLLLFIFLLSSCGTKLNSSSLSSDFKDDLYSESNNTDIKSEKLSEQYCIGDIIFWDGSAQKSENITDINKDNLPIAVIAGFKDNLSQKVYKLN